MTEHDNETGEFLPLPFFPWDRRPSTCPLEVEECATALYLSDGLVHRAAERLRCEPLKLQRMIGRHPKLQRLHAELAAILNDKAHEEVVRAFGDEDARRREWASAKVMSSEQFRGHPLAPRVEGGGSVTINQAQQRIVVLWGDGTKVAEIGPAGLDDGGGSVEDRHYGGQAKISNSD